MCTPDGLSRRSVEEKSLMDTKFLQKGQLIDLVADESDNNGNRNNIELEGIGVSKWNKCEELWLISEEHGLEVLRQHHDSQVA